MSAAKVEKVALTTLEADGKLGIPPLEPSAGEKATNDEHATLGVWVGMRPSQAGQYATNTPAAHAAKVAKKCKGIPINAEDPFDIIPKDPKALRVIAKIGDTNVNCFALHSPYLRNGVLLLVVGG
jgi:hypothetical protein